MYETDEERVNRINTAFNMMIAVERGLARRSLHFELKVKALMFQTFAAETRYGLAFRNNPANIADCWREYQDARENSARFLGVEFQRIPLPRQ